MEKEELEALVLRYLSTHETLADSTQFLTENALSASLHPLLVSVLQSLHSASYILLTSKDHSYYTMTPDGAKYRQQGTPEFQLYQELEQPTSQDVLVAKFGKDAFTLMSGQATRLRWVAFDKNTKEWKRLVENQKDQFGEYLVAIEKNEQLDEKTINELKKRKMVVLKTDKVYSATKGPKFSLERKHEETDLTAELLHGDNWKNASFKEYNFESTGGEMRFGTFHPLMKVRKEFRQILMEMGFEEMPTNNYVENSFWNFDALFQPQQHPARDSHDTFFLTSPVKSINVADGEYVQAVKTMHQTGGAGSIGYRYDWQLEEAQKNILRTHTTAVSARMCYKLAQDIKASGEFTPKRYFSIDRVFRNETLDATHLAEFHQVEGFVADYNLSLADLMGTIQTFFHRIGITNIKFKPAYNPYTEPSMEIFGYSTELGKFIEIGNSGMFRPEMLLPMGLPPNVRAIAWGLSLERPTMIKYGINNIRDLFGPKVKLDVIRSNPIARFD